MRISDFYTGGRFDPAIPTPEAFLGYAIGRRLTPAADIERYMRAIAACSDLVRVMPYGTSVEGRILYLVFVTASENHRRMDRILEIIRRLADPRTLGAGQAEALVRATPAITWLAHNVHGGEHSTGESAMVTAYLLAAGLGRDLRRIRKETVVILDPVQNPDGRERSINYFYSAFGVRPNPDPNAAEHQEPWASGRGNHYLFDLNRDWFPVTQQETSARIDAYLHHLPQVYADLHEMGHEQTYFFPPPAPPPNANFTDPTHRWWGIYGDAVGRALDGIGVPYFTGEIFDAFYPGYGESWPIFHGGIGMTFEQASARGLGIRRSDGSVLEFREAVRHHVAAAIATCRVTAERRLERLRDFHRFHRDAVEEGRAGPVKELLIPPGDDPLDGDRLARLLSKQGIEIRVARRPFAARSRSYRDDGSVSDRRFPAGTRILRLDQPRMRLIRGILERETPIDPAFLSEEVKRREDRLPSRIYDVTAWSLPLACGVETFWSEAFSEVSTAPMKSPARPILRPARTAYLLRYASNAALGCLVRLLSEGLRARVARKPFRIDDRSYGRGTIVLRTGENDKGLRDRLAGIGRDHGVAFAPVDTSRAQEGIDLGSAGVVDLKRPRVAMLYDVPGSSLSYGWSAYLFEQRYRLPFTAVRWGVLNGGDLRDYNVIVLPDGQKKEYQRYLGDEFVKRIRGWVAAGGTLLAVKGAAAFLAESGNGLTGARLVTDLRDLQAKDEEEVPADDRGEGRKKGNGKKEVPEEFRPDRIPGAILRVRLDPNHFLSYGYGEGLDVMATSDLIFTPTQKGRTVGTYEDESALRVAGFVWEKMLEALPGHAYCWDDPSERGHVIGFAEDPAFRGYWEGLHRLYLNAILFGPSLAR